MKKLLLIYSLLIASIASNAQGLWFSQSSNFTDASSGVRNISVVDSNVVWMTAYDGTGSGLPRQDYSRTTDGGNTWVANIIPAGAIWDCAMIDAVDANNAWAIFFNTTVSPIGLGQIWHTSDGGSVWTQQDPTTFSTAGQSFPNVIHFWNANDGVVIGDPVDGFFEIYTSNNGGTTWDTVPTANIPIDLTGTEAGWTTHMEVFGDTIWFDTNLNRVFRSVDKGHTWTAASTGLSAPFPGTINTVFYSGMDGIARFYDDATIANEVVETHDGGATWAPLVPTGNFFGDDIEHVPGTTSMIVSTGISANSGFIGSSYSNDGGHSWTDLETPGVTQRGTLGVADSLTMWCGGFTASPTSGGVYKFIVITPVLCGDPSITPGTGSSSAPSVCGHDTITLTSTGVHSPVTGDFSGASWIVSSADLLGSTDPINDPSFIGSWPFTFPAPSTDIRTFINDGLVIDGTNFPYGTYYFTPVVFGNATGASPVFFHDLTTDPSCTYVGTSIAVDIIDPLVCDDNGVGEINSNLFSVNSILRDRNTLDVVINSTTSGKIAIQLLDLTGRIVSTLNSSVASGKNNESINVSTLAPGVYIINAELNNSRATTRIMKY